MYRNYDATCTAFFLMNLSILPLRSFRFIIPSFGTSMVFYFISQEILTLPLCFSCLNNFFSYWPQRVQSCHPLGRAGLHTNCPHVSSHSISQKIEFPITFLQLRTFLARNSPFPKQSMKSNRNNHRAIIIPVTKLISSL